MAGRCREGREPDSLVIRTPGMAAKIDRMRGKLRRLRDGEAVSREEAVRVAVETWLIRHRSA